MKIIITGTTAGLGLACKEYFSPNHSIIEYNRPQHNLDVTVDTYVTTDFDVYINNAYSGWGQVDLLYKLYEANKDRQCMIINIGSVSADGNYDFINPYAVHKAALDKACMQMQLLNTECRVIQFKIGRMDTRMVAHRPPPKLSPVWVAQQIDHVINMPSDVLPKTIVLDNVGGRKNDTIAIVP